MTTLLERPDLVSALAPRPVTRNRRPTWPATRSTVSHPHAAGLEIVGADASVPLAGGGRIAYANLDHGASAPVADFRAVSASNAAIRSGRSRRTVMSPYPYGPSDRQEPEARACRTHLAPGQVFTRGTPPR